MNLLEYGRNTIQTPRKNIYFINDITYFVECLLFTLFSNKYHKFVHLQGEDPLYRNVRYVEKHGSASGVW